MKKEKIEEVLYDLNTVGYHKTNIIDILGPECIDSFNQVSEFFEEMLNNPDIYYRLETIKQGLNTIGKDKFYEITHYEHLNRSLNLKDGGLFNLYLDDFFVELAKKFLDVDNPLLFNVLFFIHGQCPPTRSGSQNWHRDLEDLKILKLFIYFCDVTKKNGALEYVPKSFCGGDFPLNQGNQMTDADYRRTRIIHENLEKEFCDPNAVVFEGKPGDIILCNNTGFHRGGFVAEGFRCMTHALYIRPDAQFRPPNINYDSKVNFIDVNSIEYKNLKEKQKHLWI